MASSNSVLMFLLSLSCVLLFSCKGQGKGHVSGCILVAYVCFCLQCGADRGEGLGSAIIATPFTRTC